MFSSAKLPATMLLVRVRPPPLKSAPPMLVSFAVMVLLLRSPSPSLWMPLPSWGASFPATVALVIVSVAPLALKIPPPEPIRNLSPEKVRLPEKVLASTVRCPR